MDIPPWVGTMSTGQRAVMLCSWGVKAGMARVILVKQVPYLSALEARLLRLSAIQNHVYFTLLYFTSLKRSSTNACVGKLSTCTCVCTTASDLKTCPCGYH